MRRRPRVKLVVAGLVSACLVMPAAQGSAEGPWPAADHGAHTEDAAYSSVPRPVAPVEDEAGAGAGEEPTRAASVVTGSAWSWYMDPRVLATSRATYFSSVNNTGDVQVTSVDHGTARLRHAVLQPEFEPDDHNAPSLTELEDGRVVAFWNAHGLVPAHYRITLRSGDVTTFGPAMELTGSGLEEEGTTYTSIIQLRGEKRRYHLFTRRSSDDAWVMTTSEDLITWTPAVRLLAHVDDESYPYVKFAGNGWDTIHMVFSDTTARPGHRSSLHHMSFSKGVFRRSDGSAIRSLDAVAGTGRASPRPIEPGLATRIHAGYDGDGQARPYDIALDGQDPVVALTTGDTRSKSWTHRWMRRRGDAWTGSTLLRSAAAPEGVTLQQSDPDRVLLVRAGRLEEYRTTDGGASWTRRPVASGDDHRTPATPWSAPGAGSGPVSAAWLSGQYGGFRKGAWSTTLMMATSGPAPIDLQVGWPSRWVRGAGVHVTARAGVGGAGVAGRKAWLVFTSVDDEEEWVSAGRTDEEGEVELTLDRAPSPGTRVRVVLPRTPEWGKAFSPPRVVPGVRP